jgi:hypothetical protein
MSEAPTKMTFQVSARRVDTDEKERRIALLHDNVRNDVTVFNTVSPGARWTSP